MLENGVFVLVPQSRTPPAPEIDEGQIGHNVCLWGGWPHSLGDSHYAGLPPDRSGCCLTKDTFRNALERLRSFTFETRGATLCFCSTRFTISYAQPLLEAAVDC